MGDTNCAGSKTFESTPFLVAEVDGNEGCVNLDVAPADSLAEKAVYVTDGVTNPLENITSPNFQNLAVYACLVHVIKKKYTH